LVANGLELNRMYVYRGCAPTRSSFQSGRLPVHVTTDNGDGISNPTHGIPAAMTGIASKMKEANYKTYLIGKWDAGFATTEQLPRSKGWDYFYGYLGKAIGYFDSKSYDDCPNVGNVDLWENDGPAFSGKDGLTQHASELDDYVEFWFKRKVLEILNNFDNSNEDEPFMIMYSSHLPHFPTQIPQQFLEQDLYGNDESMCEAGIDYVYPGFNDSSQYQCRTILQSQVNLLDAIVGQIVDKLHSKNLWDDTLVVFQSDNGGHIQLKTGAGNNYPLRGGKETDFDGGIRAVSFVTGGYLPDSRRGQVENGLMHISDWYATFTNMVGVDERDPVAVDAGLPDVDGLNLWPLISGQVSASPRTDMVISTTTYIAGDFKLMIGGFFRYAIWQSPVWPDIETPEQEVLDQQVLKCLIEAPCLFNIVEDESEIMNIAEMYPNILDGMKQRFAIMSQSFYENDRVGTDSCPEDYSLEVQVGVGRWSSRQLSCGCWMSIYNYNSFTGPYQDLSSNLIRYTIKQMNQQQKAQELNLQADDGTLEAAPMDYSESIAVENDEPVDYSNRFEHFKVDEDAVIVEDTDYSSRFSHFKVEADNGDWLYRRGGEESMTLRDEQMANQMVVGFAALMVALGLVTFVKCIKHGKELLLPDNRGQSYEELL